MQSFVSLVLCHMLNNRFCAALLITGIVQQVIQNRCYTNGFFQLIRCDRAYTYLTQSILYNRFYIAALVTGIV